MLSPILAMLKSRISRSRGVCVRCVLLCVIACVLLSMLPLMVEDTHRTQRTHVQDGELDNVYVQNSDGEEIKKRLEDKEILDSLQELQDKLADKPVHSARHDTITTTAYPRKHRHSKLSVKDSAKEEESEEAIGDTVINLKLSDVKVNYSQTVRPPRNLRGVTVHYTPPPKWNTAVLVETGNAVQMKMVTEMNTTSQLWIWGRDIIGECQEKQYDLTKLSSVSVIISFHQNEKLHHLLHTIHSIIKRTPDELLEEIILIDDNSKKDDHKDVLHNYITSVFSGKNIRLFRSKTSLGLIKARLVGAKLAVGDVIVSMDSHMEVQDRWLEPLLDEIAKNPRTLAASYLDWMETDIKGNWVYKHGPSTWKTYFDWSFVFGFQDISNHEKQRRMKDPTQPIESPVTIGTIWAMDREVFMEIGAFDEQMEGWGGENLDLPIRVWLCGGRVINVPCSHAAHLEEHGHRDYRSTWQYMINRNYKRVAEVWLGDYLRFFYYYHQDLQTTDVGDLSSRREIRDKCYKKYGRDLSWYFKNAYPELGMPGGNASLAWHGLKNDYFNTCVVATPPNDATIENCHPNPSRQGFYWDIVGHLRFPIHVFEGKQMSASAKLVSREFIGAYNTSGVTRWIHWKGGWMMMYPIDQCLEASASYKLYLKPCDKDNPKQRWSFYQYTELYHSLETLAKSKNKVKYKMSKMAELFGEPVNASNEMYRVQLLKKLSQGA